MLHKACPSDSSQEHRNTIRKPMIREGYMNTIRSEKVLGVMTLYLSRKLRFEDMYFRNTKACSIWMKQMLGLLKCFGPVLQRV